MLSLLAFTFLLPISMAVFIINTAMQTTLSKRRLKEMNTNKTNENRSGIWACDTHKIEQGISVVDRSLNLLKYVMFKKDVNGGS